MVVVVTSYTLCEFVCLLHSASFASKPLHAAAVQETLLTVCITDGYT